MLEMPPTAMVQGTDVSDPSPPWSLDAASRLIAPPSVLPSPSALRPEQAGRWSSEPDPAEAVLKPEGWRYLVQAVAGLRRERNHGRSAAGPWSGPGGWGWGCRGRRDGRASRR